MELLKDQQVKTFLPIFSGFYNSIWQYDDDYVISTIDDDRQEKNIGNIDFDNLDIDYVQYEIDISKELCDIVKDQLSDYIKNIEYENIYSPKAYNFSNNVINCIITPNIDNIKKFIYQHKDQFCQYLKDKYTSCDGFISHYANDFLDWETDTNNFEDLNINGHVLGSILEFIANIEDITELDIYYIVNDNIDQYSYIDNIDKCYNSLICNKCQKFIEDPAILKDAEKYKKLMSKYPANIVCSECI